MEAVVAPTLAFISVHSGWAGAILFLTAFGESFAFVSLLFPGTSLLVAAGTLMSVGSLPYPPVLLGAVFGAVLGDTVSFMIGRHFGGAVAGIWPFSRYPDLLPRGIRYFTRYGGVSVFLGRFFGPVRAVIPLVAGIMEMPSDRFWVANVGSAVVWAPMLLLVGDLVGKLGERVMGSSRIVVAVFVGMTVLGIAGLIWSMLRSARPKT
jgi:membrane protein DedA with SNARE-associated domain